MTRGSVTRIGSRGDDDEQDQAEQRAEAFRQATDGLDLPEGYRLPPRGWAVTRGGVWRLTPQALVASAPLLPVRLWVDPDGRESVELAWRCRGRWVHRIVPRSAVSSGRALIAALADDGLPVIAADAAKAERWLSVVEGINRAVIPVEVLARWIGWQPDGTFVCGPDDGRKVEPPFPAIQAVPLAAHRPHGTFRQWQDTVQVLNGFPLAVMVVSVAFGAPLLRVLRLPSFVVDVYGRSTRGKTTTSRAMVSVWGDPSDTGALSSWATTMAALEQRVALVKGLPVALDETQHLKHPKRAGLGEQTIYAVGSGRFTARVSGAATKWASALAVETIILSTGERSLLTFTTDQGAAARVLTVASPPIPAGAGSGEMAAALTAGVEDHYGHAGPAFAARLTAGLSRPGWADALRERHAEILGELLATLPAAADIARRRAPGLAALILGARLASEWAILPVTVPEIPAWIEAFQGEQETDNRAEMALDVVRGYLAAHPDDLYRGTLGASPARGWAGRVYDWKGSSTVALLPERLRAILREAEYELDAVRAWWRDEGVLVTVEERDKKTDRSRTRDTVKLNMPRAGKPRMYMFTPGRIDLTGDDGE